MSNENKNLNFGKALEAAKIGKSIARSGWNGKEMCVYLNKGSFDGQFAMINNEQIEAHTKQFGLYPSTLESLSFSLFTIGDKGTVTRLPNLNMKAASGSTVTGWLASQTDLLAEDWEILD